MTTRQFGASVKRNEDARLLAGRAQFIDDVKLAGILHAAFVRSPHAHARIVSIDASAALLRDGVVAVYTAEDLGDYWRPGPVIVPPPPVEGAVFNERTQVPLAKGKARHVGEPVALVIAASRYIAEDAAADVVVEWDALPVAADLEPAAAPGAPRVHDDLPDNVAARVRQTKGDYAAAAKRAHRIVKRRFAYDHGCAQPMETRGVVAQWDAGAERLTVWDTTQAPIAIRNGLAAMLGLSERQVRVVAPFIGGGFGPKIMLFYPDEVLIPWAALKLGRPVKWIEDRAEHFFATTHERGQMHDAEIALDRDGRILGVKDVFLHDTGAYDPYGLTVPINSQCTLLGPYVIPNYDSTFTAVFTNKPIVTPYRGAGRQHGVFVIERLLDVAARELGIDRAEIRRRNLIPSDAFPYDNEIIYQDFTRLGYDSGDYAPMLGKALDMIDYERFLREEQPRLRAQGRRVGIGVVCYVEGTGIGPYEGAKVQVQTSGKVSLLTGIGTQGQGHFTSFAQIVADQVGVAVSDVEVITGDTDQFYWGAGTFASRGAVVAGNAVNEAALAVRKKILRVASEHFECAEADLVIEDGAVSIAGVPGRRIGLGELAVQANPHARRGRARHRARPRGDELLRPGERRDRSRRARDDRRGRPRNDDPVDPQVRRGARLRHRDQSDDRRGPGARGRRPRHRQRVLRAARIRRGGTAPQRDARRLPVARRRSTCRASSSATPSRRRRSTRSASKAWARRARYRSGRSSPRRSRTRSNCRHGARS